MELPLPLDVSAHDPATDGLPSPKSAQTIEAYERDFRRYCVACSRDDRPVFAGDSVAAYLEELATSPPAPEDHRKRVTPAARAVIPRTHAYSTIRRRLVGIAHAFAMERARTGSKEPRDPRTHPAVVDILHAVRANMDRVADGEDIVTARPPTPVIPISPDAVRNVVMALREPCETAGDTRRAARDRVMILLYFCGALTRGELRGLRVCDVTFADDGMVLRVNRSEFRSRARDVAVARGSDRDTCPVAALEDYLAAVGFANPQSYIFVRIDGPRGFIAADAPPLHVRRFAQIVDERAAAAGFDPKAFSALGFRTGIAVQIHRAGGSIANVMEQTGHRSARQVESILKAGASWAPRSAAMRGL